jgi:hypothetical protein
MQDIATIGKLVFVGENIQLQGKDGDILATEPIADIKKIQFATNGTNADLNDTVVRTIIVYPNPTQDILIIQGAESQMLRVYNLQGSLLQTEWGNQIAVSHLPVGTYLLQIGTQVVRFIKK